MRSVFNISVNNLNTAQKNNDKVVQITDRVFNRHPDTILANTVLGSVFRDRWTEHLLALFNRKQICKLKPSKTYFTFYMRMLRICAVNYQISVGNWHRWYDDPILSSTFLGNHATAYSALTYSNTNSWSCQCDCLANGLCKWTLESKTWTLMHVTTSITSNLPHENPFQSCFISCINIVHGSIPSRNGLFRLSTKLRPPRTWARHMYEHSQCHSARFCCACQIYAHAWPSLSDHNHCCDWSNGWTRTVWLIGRIGPLFQRRNCCHTRFLEEGKPPNKTKNKEAMRGTPNCLSSRNGLWVKIAVIQGLAVLRHAGLSIIFPCWWLFWCHGLPLTFSAAGPVSLSFHWSIAGLILHGGKRGHWLCAPWSMPWCLWNALVEATLSS